MIAVTGAVMTLSTFIGASERQSRVFASGDFTKMILARFVLALVGPHFMMSYYRRNNSSETDCSTTPSSCAPF